MDAIQEFIKQLSQKCETLPPGEAIAYRSWLVQISKEHLALVDELKAAKSAIDTALALNGGPARGGK